MPTMIKPFSIKAKIQGDLTRQGQKLYEVNAA